MTKLSQLLPRNSTPLERALADAMAARVDPDVIARYHNPDTCPAELLPWLAWESHVDGWETAVTESQQRALIRNSWDLHKYKGTPWAVLTALAAIGYPRAKLTEWWEQAPQGHPGTFRVALPWQPALGNTAEWTRIKSAVAAYKNVRSWPEWAVVVVPVDPADPGNLPDDPAGWPVPAVQTYARASAVGVAHYRAPAPQLAASAAAGAGAALVARHNPPAGRVRAAVHIGGGAGMVARFGQLPPDDWQTWRPAQQTMRTAAAAVARAAALAVARHSTPAGRVLAVVRIGGGAGMIARLGRLPAFDAWRERLLTDDNEPLLTDDGIEIAL